MQTQPLRVGALRGEQQRQGQDGYHTGSCGKSDVVGNMKRGDADEHADEVRDQPHEPHADAERMEAAARLLDGGKRVDAAQPAFAEVLSG